MAFVYSSNKNLSLCGNKLFKEISKLIYEKLNASHNGVIILGNDSETKHLNDLFKFKQELGSGQTATAYEMFTK